MRIFIRNLLFCITMIITKIQIKEHLCEYVYGKFCSCEKKPVQFPSTDDIYHSIQCVTNKRPDGAIDSGNLELCIPDQRIGKRPEVYNWISAKGIKILEKKIEIRMWAELHDAIDTNKHRYGIPYITTVYEFMCKYGITSISEDALLKNYYRWRDRVRKKEKRNYTKAKRC